MVITHMSNFMFATGLVPANNQKLNNFNFETFFITILTYMFLVLVRMRVQI